MPLTLRQATFAVVDVETTGIDAAVDRVVEVACVIVRGGRQIDAFSSLIHPGRAIPAVASAIHHITDRHVRHAPALEDVRETLAAMCETAVVVAHNASFDRRFLPFLGLRPWMCSMRLAMRVVPDAPNYRNQVLRYHLGIDSDVFGEGIPHRALDDAAVTGRILDVCLGRYLAQGGRDDVDALVHEIAAPRLLSVLPFGKHRGLAIRDVPDDYLRWLRDESRSASADARHTAAMELERRATAHDTENASFATDQVNEPRSTRLAPERRWPAKIPSQSQVRKSPIVFDRLPVRDA